MPNRLALLVVLILLAAIGWYVTRPDATTSGMKTAKAEPQGTDIVAVTVPGTLTEPETIGKRAFEARCAVCHGINGVGVDGSGPPLVHKIYEPSHHGDMSFQLAVRRGVQAHHWRFGDMPPQPGLSEGEVGMIIAYIRRVQRENGIR